MNSVQILTRAEVLTVLADLKRRAKRSGLSRQNLIVFRLACCHGLAAVRDAVGHASVATTNIYAHLVEQEQVTDLFAESPK